MEAGTQPLATSWPSGMKVKKAGKRSSRSTNLEINRSPEAEKSSRAVEQRHLELKYLKEKHCSKGEMPPSEEISTVAVGQPSF